MKIINVTFVTTDDGLTVVPNEPLPQNSIANIFDGEKYTIYEEGDELPNNVLNEPM